MSPIPEEKVLNKVYEITDAEIGRVSTMFLLDLRSFVFEGDRETLMITAQRDGQTIINADHHPTSLLHQSFIPFLPLPPAQMPSPPSGSLLRASSKRNIRRRRTSMAAPLRSPVPPSSPSSSFPLASPLRGLPARVPAPPRRRRRRLPGSASACRASWQEVTILPDSVNSFS